MKDVVQLLIQNPTNAITVMAIFVAGMLIVFFKKHLEAQFKSFGERLAGWEVSIGNHMNETRSALSKHAEEMGKISKAVNTDILELKGDMVDMRQDLLGRIGQLKDFARQLEHESKMISTSLQLRQSFQEKKVREKEQ